MKAPHRFLALGATLALGACTTCPLPADVSKPTARYSEPQFAGRYDGGQLVLKSDPAWMKRVAVYSPDAELQEAATKIVRDNFPVNIVGVPASHFLIRLIPCSNETVIAICVNAQFNSSIVSTTEFRANAPCSDKGAQRILEDFLFRDEEIHQQFIDFVREAMESLPDRS